jgi:hypothetical protein
VPNYDGDAGLLIGALEVELRRLEGDGASRVILAIDAPLATKQTNLPPRPRAADEDKPVGQRRSCDTLFSQTKEAIGGPWGRAAQIQPGAPLCPRVHRLVERLIRDLGFSLWDARTPPGASPTRTLIEIFPAEAIWSLGVSGLLGRNAPDSIRLYKSLGGRHVTLNDALDWACRPLRGFVSLLSPGLDVATAVEKLAVWACADALPDETIVLTKRYDDLVDSGIAWLTALAFAHENYHVLAAPDGDGHIVGPAHLPSIPEPLKVRHPPKISSPVSESATLIAKGVSCYCGCGTATGSFFALASRVHTNRARHVSSCRRILQGTQRVHQ